MTAIDLLACIAVGFFIGLGALGLGYAVFLACLKLWGAIHRVGAASVKITHQVNDFVREARRSLPK